MTLHRPRPLEATDDVSRFSSGEPSLDHYLRTRALANHVSGVARCHVSLDDASGLVIGYYTLSAISVQRTEVSARARRNAPRAIPAVLLGRLAVDRRAQGAGLGRSLVRDALLRTLAAADRIGVRLLLVHAINEQAVGFYASLGFAPSPTDPLHLYVLLADAHASLSGETSREPPAMGHPR